MKKALLGLFLATLLLFILWAALLGFPKIYIGPYSLDGIDALNLWYEEKNRISEPDRTIYIKALMDEEYKNMVVLQKDYGFIWQQGSLYFTRSLEPEEFIERIIKRASKSFEYQFGIELVLVEIKTWHPQSQTTNELFEELKTKTTLENCDIIVGFSGRVKDWAALGLGSLPQEETLGNHILILPSFPEGFDWIGLLFNSYRLQSYVLIHELGHNFGAVHPNEIHSFPVFPNITNINEIYKLDYFAIELWQYAQKIFSVMSPETMYLTTRFDQYNKEVIFKNKYLPSK